VHPNEALVQRFYAAFQARDAEAMAACYHSEVVFSDPVFGELRGERARDMWRMLCGRAKDLAVAASDVRADDATGSARWVATYSFGRDGRRVRNVISARFAFRDGLIARHEDSFPLWRWSRMALGPVGVLLGWTPLLQGRIRADARRGLDAFVAARR
jgi:ketosteroid isomerase-like protein